MKEKRMKKREADFSIVMRHWIKANPLRHTCGIEVKQTTEHSIPFNAVEPQQAAYHDAVETSDKGVLIRIQGTNGEMDYVYMYRDPVYIFIKFPGLFCVIKRLAFETERVISKRKSLTVDRAREIAWQTIDL